MTWSSFSLAFIEGVSNSRSIKSFQQSIDDQTTLSSLDDDERTFISLSSDDGSIKCSIQYLILIFYGGMLLNN